MYTMDSMHMEVSVALNFVISYLYNKLPRRRVDCFGEELEKEIKKKFEGHWYPDKPFKGSAFRSIKVNGENMDPVMEQSAIMSGLDISEIRVNLPKDLTVWIDPNEVSYRIGERGAAKLLYSEKTSKDDEITEADKEVQNASKGFNPEAQSFKPIDTLSSSLSSLSLSPIGSSPNGWCTSPTQQITATSPMSGAPQHHHHQQQQQHHHQQQQQQQQQASTSPINSYIHRNSNATFTAATFAQTKFGSTKLKSNVKRPSRLSPTEFGSYLRQRATFQGPWMTTHPQAAAIQPPQLIGQRQQPLSPRDPRADYLEHQQRLMLLQQNQFNQLHSPNLLSPIGGPATIGDIYSQHPFIGLSEMAPANVLNRSKSPSPQSNSLQQGSISPVGSTSSSVSSSGSGTLLDSINWGQVPAAYGNLQHLLVAN